MIQEAKRLSSVKEYYFSQKLREVASLKAEGKPVLNLGIGSPDLAPPTEVVEAMQLCVSQETSHGYQSYQGTPELREAFANFYEGYFDVKLDYQNEVLPMMGSKEAIMHISMAFLNPGDQVLIPNPGYPTYTSVSELVGAEVATYNLKGDQNWEINFEELEQNDLSKVKLMWVNYPHMPTGSKGSRALLEDIVAFAQKHEILVVNDNPYSFVLNQEYNSILSIPGSDAYCLELNSLSKSFNMAGWRVGALLGNKDLLKSVLKVKSNMDSGMFLGIQKGAIAALSLDKQWFSKMNSVYQLRRTLVWEIMDLLGCVYDQKAVGMFVWAKVPAHQNAQELCDSLLYDKSIFITPGFIFGSNGEDYIRISLCSNEGVLKEVINRLKS
ncbi:MAG: pyridoxal phosphate-dependent aminotransferase [Flavobacteriaceae bacterium]